jgi:hypothetical protein
MAKSKGFDGGCGNKSVGMNFMNQVSISLESWSTPLGSEE